jgi:hypothetical protein
MSKHILVIPANEDDMKLALARLTEKKFFPRYPTAPYASTYDTLPQPLVSSPPSPSDTIYTPGYDYRQLFICYGLFDNGILLKTREPVDAVNFGDYILTERWMSDWQLSATPTFINVDDFDSRIIKMRQYTNQAFVEYQYINRIH